MRQEQFERLRQGDWGALGRYLEDPSFLPSDEVPARYRALCHDLAVARERHYSSGLLSRLHHLAFQVHQRLYGDSESLRHTWWNYLRSGFPRHVRAEWRCVLGAAALFLVPMVLMFIL